MKKHIGWLCIVGFFSLIAAAAAQTAAPSSANTQFDGTYAFVSATKLNETFFSTSERMKSCPNRQAVPLTIENGRARLPGSSRLTSEGFEGTVGPQGELAMRLAPTPLHKDFPGYEIIITGRISGDSTVLAREIRMYCNYDLVWRKESK